MVCTFSPLCAYLKAVFLCRALLEIWPKGAEHDCSWWSRRREDHVLAGGWLFALNTASFVSVLPSQRARLGFWGVGPSGLATGVDSMFFFKISRDEHPREDFQGALFSPYPCTTDQGPNVNRSPKTSFEHHNLRGHRRRTAQTTHGTGGQEWQRAIALLEALEEPVPCCSVRRR